MADLFGHLLYIVLFFGQFKMSRGRRWGWLVMAVAMIGWSVMGFLVLNITSVGFWSAGFAGLNLYGFIKWKRKAP